MIRQCSKNTLLLYIIICFAVKVNSSFASIVLHPSNITSYQNDTISLSCKFDQAVNCSWTKCNNPFSIGSGRISYISNSGRNTTDCSIKIKNIEQNDSICPWICESKTRHMENYKGIKSNKAWVILKSASVEKATAATKTATANLGASVEVPTAPTKTATASSIVMTTTEEEKKNRLDSKPDWDKEFPVGVVLSAAVSGGLVTLVFIAAIIGFACYRCMKNKRQHPMHEMPVIHSVGNPPVIQYGNMCRHSLMIPSTTNQPCYDSHGYLTPTSCMGTIVGQSSNSMKSSRCKRPCDSISQHFYEEIHEI